MDKLFYDNSYLTVFQANIIECNKSNDKYEIVLDNTYFYPESGGQPSDIGYINNIEVVSVLQKSTKTLHIVESPLELGSADCRINWEVRFDHMQQHSGQHLLSSCFYKLYNGNTSSFTIGQYSSTIEIDITEFDTENLREIENLANRIIYDNIPITSKIVNSEELPTIPLRKSPKVLNNIRVVEISGTDFSPCGGTHVIHTGEIGIIKIKKWEKLKDSYKFDFVCGKRAIDDYRVKNITINNIASSMSVKDFEVEDTYNKLIEDQTAFKKQYSLLKQKLSKYEAEYLLKEALDLSDKKFIFKVFKDKQINDLKQLAQLITKENTSVITLLISKSDNIQLILMRSDNLDMNMGKILKTILVHIDGKGGGSSQFAQGGGKLDGIDNLYNNIIQIISNQHH